MKSLSSHFIIALGLTIAALLFITPFITHAQTSSQDQLRATIQAAITADPRSASMTQAQISAMVDALTVQANKQNVTASDIVWRPQALGPEVLIPVAPACWGFPTFFCTLDDAFGFSGTDQTIPLSLFAASAAFILVLGLMREHRHPTVALSPTHSGASL
jgi:hypothetical protein